MLFNYKLQPLNRKARFVLLPQLVFLNICFGWNPWQSACENDPYMQNSAIVYLGRLPPPRYKPTHPYLIAVIFEGSYSLRYGPAMILK